MFVVVGDAVPLTFGSPAVSATLTVERPTGVVDTPTVGAPSNGVFTVSYMPAVAGRYVVRWTDGQGRASADVFNAASAVLALCSLDDAKKHINMTSTVDDEELRGHIEAATGVIERHRNEIVARRALSATVCAGEVLPDWPVLSVTSATTVSGGASMDVSGSGWAPDPVTGQVTVPAGTPRCAVVYVAGYQVVPPEFVLAAEIIAAHLWETQRAQPVGPPALGAPDMFLSPSGQGFAIPNRAIELLGGRAPVIA